MTTIYQLQASGETREGWEFHAASQEVFLARADAEAHIDKFRRECCDGGRADIFSLQIMVHELRLQPEVIPFC